MRAFLRIVKRIGQNCATELNWVVLRTK